MANSSLELVNNKDRKQYEYHVEGHVARLEYIEAKNSIYLTHTEVPKAMGGKGIGTALVKAALEDVKARNLVLVPLCPFVALYIKRHPEWRQLVLKGVNIQ